MKYFTNLKVVATAIGSIVTLIVLAFAFNTSLEKKFVSAEVYSNDLELTKEQILENSENQRKGEIKGKVYWIDLLMYALEERYGGATADNLDMRRRYKAHEARKDCLNAAIDIVGKQPEDCL